MKQIMLASLLSLAFSVALADAPKEKVEAPTDARRVLGPKDRVVVNFSQVRKYRCSEGALIAEEYGALMRLRCAPSGTITAR